jgi:hypothetical protein
MVPERDGLLMLAIIRRQPSNSVSFAEITLKSLSPSIVWIHTAR